MILVPEIETIVLLVPRTGSGSLRRAVLARYPSAIALYRHMEADGVPAGYDRWRKVGVVRNPFERLWSLYKFLRTFDGPYDAAYIAKQRASVAMPFGDWIVNNQTVFTCPYDSGTRGRFFPYYTVRHALPETRKSQFIYLRPDLGTVVHRFDRLDDLAADLKIELPHVNETPTEPPPRLTGAPRHYMATNFDWDWKAAS